MPTRVVFRFFLILALCWLSGRLGRASELPHHRLEVRIDPARGELQVEDAILLPGAFAQRQLSFALNSALTVSTSQPGVELRELNSPDNARHATPVPVRHYRLSWSSLPGDGLMLRYSGRIQHAIEQEPEEYARSFSSTPGLISPEGVFLAGSSHWIPMLEAWDHLTFSLKVEIPEPFDVVSQGRRNRHEVQSGQRLVGWDEENPMEEIYLIAAPFHEYQRDAGSVTAYAFLREPDPNLAARYLEATVQYIDMYGRLLGPYPYSKFALVENFWETGYGMPSFTLLGPTVIRLPFILHSSYPHEILHNWWGNSVYVKAEEGNWCEGLTAYMADHLTKEGQNQGAEYRRDTLKNYRNFASESRDFALRDFRSRHSPSSEAVGYGKSLMLWHMLRVQLGDELFVRALAQFYRKYRYQAASFDAIQQVFSQVAGEDLEPLFDQWVSRVGAPELRLESATSRAVSGGYLLEFEVAQVQPGEPYQLRVPIAITLKGLPAARIELLEMKDRRQSLQVRLERQPLLVEVDPDFDLFRKLDRKEIPPSLGQLFGSRSVLLVVPSDPGEESAWRRLAEAWRSPDARFRIVREDEIRELPGDSSVWILGSSNRWRNAAEGALKEYSAGLSGERILFGEVAEPLEDRSFVLVSSHPDNPAEALGWVGSTRADAIPGLARKLPHYGKYSYLAFSGEEPVNTIKGQWPTFTSPLVRRLDDTPGLEAGARPARAPLASLSPVFSPDRIRRHFQTLTSARFEGRGVGTRGLDLAADYIAEQFHQMGLEPAGDDGTYFQSWQEDDGPNGPVTLRNVVARLPGKRADWAAQSLVLSAHYDHLGKGWPDVRESERGKIHPGADDNASGVAVLLEVAQLLAHQMEPDRSLLFVAFSGEEWGLRGSRHFVRNPGAWPVNQMMANVNLDSVGRLQGRDLLVLGGGSASEWVHIARGIGFTTGISSRLVADDMGSSDQRSFLDAGVPAVQIFAGAHPDYHRSTDTADKLDLAGMIQVASFVREAIVYLSERETPLTSNLSPGGTDTPAPAASGSSRRASLGTVPDFSYSGPGVRVESLVPNSPAAAAGILAGDILIRMDGQELADLRAYSNALARHQPGDEVQIVVRREGGEVTLRARLGSR